MKESITDNLTKKKGNYRKYFINLKEPKRKKKAQRLKASIMAKILEKGVNPILPKTKKTRRKKLKKIERRTYVRKEGEQCAGLS